MTTSGHDTDPNFSTVSELLLAEDAILAGLIREADARLRRRDAEGYRDVLRQRTERIASLPALLTSYREGGGKVPEEVAAVVDGHSVLAEQSLEKPSGWVFDQGVLLVPNDPSQPNELQRLAAKYGSEPRQE